MEHRSSDQFLPSKIMGIALLNHIRYLEKYLNYFYDPFLQFLDIVFYKRFLKGSLHDI